MWTSPWARWWHAGGSATGARVSSLSPKAMTLLHVIIGTGIACIVPTVDAQAAVAPGTRIRLVAVESKKVTHRGAFIRFSADTLTFRDERAVVYSIPMAGYRVEVADGRHRHVGSGAALGAGLGFAAAVVLTTSFDNSLPCGNDGSGNCAARDLGDDLEMGFLVLSAGAGAIVGAIVGMIPRERWKATDLQPQVSPATTTGGWRVGFKLTL